jgi:hypothetical protein
MSLEYIRKTYGVPAFRGARVRYETRKGRQPWFGRITSADGAYLRILRDGDKRTYPARFHPTWGMTYLDNAKGQA